MTHDELLAEIDVELRGSSSDCWHEGARALRTVVELHKPKEISLTMKVWGTISQYRPEDVGNIVICIACTNTEYPCPTIQVIEKELG